MLSDRPFLGAKVAGWWIVLSLCKYAPHLNLHVGGGSCAEPNSKQFVLLSTLASVSLEEASETGSSTEKRAPFSLKKKSAAEVRSRDPLQLPEELKRDVCVSVADVWICAI